MGNSTSRVAGCFAAPFGNGKDNVVDLDFLDTLDEGLGHSFCYVRPVVFDSPGITPSNSERFMVDSTANFDLETNGGSFRREEDTSGTVSKSGFLPETTFKTISGASVSANATTARTTGNSSILYTADVQEPAASFESTASFAAIPLQPVPRGVSGDLNGGFMSGPLERGFASGPLEKGGVGGDGFFMSGPLERGGSFLSGPLDYNNNRSNFSGGIGRRRRGVAGLRHRLMRSVSGSMRNAFSQTFAKHISDRSWMQRFFHPSNTSTAMTANQNFAGPSETEFTESRNLQWAHGKAGEDRVHVVLSEEQGWLFIGIYDGFSGPDAPDFLMCNLYRAIDKELEGLLWDYEEEETSENGRGERTRSMRLSELLQMELMEEYATDRSLSVSDITSRRFDSISFQTEHVSHTSDGQRLKRSAVGAKLKKIVKKQKSLRKKLFPWNYDWDRDRNRTHQMNDVDRGFPTTAEEESGPMPNRRLKSGPVDHDSILDAMTRGLQSTEDAYVAMVESTLDTNPELALMGSCVLVMLMKDEDVYVMNLGDSRVVLAQENNPGNNLPTCPSVGKELDRISEESPIRKTTKSQKSQEMSIFRLRFDALQLSSDHSTSIDEVVCKC